MCEKVYFGLVILVSFVFITVNAYWCGRVEGIQESDKLCTKRIKAQNMRPRGRR